jgi:hypothetical protein
LGGFGCVHAGRLRIALRFFQRWIELGRVGKARRGVGEACGRGIVGFIERVGAFGHRRDEFLGVPEAPVLGLVLGPLPRVEA